MLGFRNDRDAVLPDLWDTAQVEEWKRTLLWLVSMIPIVFDTDKKDIDVIGNTFAILGFESSRHKLVTSRDDILFKPNIVSASNFYLKGLAELLELAVTSPSSEHC